MANNFLSGFQTGQNFFNDRNKLALEQAANARAQAAADRDAERWENEKADRLRLKGIEGQIDNEFEQMRNPNIGLYRVGQQGGSTGMQAPQFADPEALSIQTAPTGLGARMQPPAEGQIGLGAAAPRLGLQASAAKVDLEKTPVRGPLSRIEQEQSLGRIAALKQDVEGVRKSRDAQYKLEFEDGMSKGYKSWNQMKPEDQTKVMKEITENAGIPFNMVPGEKGKYWIWVTGKPPIEIGKVEAAELYAAGTMLETHPELAREKLMSGNEKLRGIAKDYFTQTNTALGTNNTATRYANQDAHDDQMLRAARERNGILSRQGENKTPLKTSFITQMGPDGKQVKVPVAFSLDRGPDGGPQLKAWTMDGKQVTDQKYLNQIAGGGDGGSDEANDPVVQNIQMQIAKYSGNTDPDKYASAQTAIAELTNKLEAHRLTKRIAVAQGPERIEIARGVLSSGGSPSQLKELGFTDAEIKASKAKPAAMAGKGEAAAGDGEYEASLRHLKRGFGSYGQLFVGPNDFIKIANDPNAPAWQRQTAKEYLRRLENESFAGQIKE